MQRDGDQQRLLDEEQQQQQEAEEQQDEPMLGSEQRGFVPAFSPQYDVDDDERCLLVRERDRDEVVQLTNAPSAGAALTYCVFYLLGIGTMTPWNFFVTAEDVSSDPPPSPPCARIMFDLQAQLLRRCLRRFLISVLALCFLLMAVLVLFVVVVIVIVFSFSLFTLFWLSQRAPHA